MSLRAKYEYVCWLQEYDWDWFCTWTLRPGIYWKQASQLLRDWVAALESLEGKRLSWFRMTEHGGELGRLHFHGLVAGPRHVSIDLAEDLWSRMAGSAVIDEYYADEMGLNYCLKSIENGPDFDIDLQLFDEHLRVRRPHAPESR